MKIRTHITSNELQGTRAVEGAAKAARGSTNGNEGATKDADGSASFGRVLEGDARDRLQEIPDESVDCIVTSPPYFRLRNYRHDAQLGLEAHVDMWVDELVGIARELRRCLKSSGSFWLNLGDSYSRGQTFGAAAKSLLLAPERLALALVADGWILRSKVIWAKTNPLPSSTKDRLSCSYEVVYFFTKSPHYFFDLDAIRVQPKGGNTGASAEVGARRRYVSARSIKDRGADERRSVLGTDDSWRGPLANTNSGLADFKARGLGAHPLGKNPGDVWSMATSNYRSAHHATYPPSLVERPIKATCPEKVCAKCGEPWTRTVGRSIGHLAVVGELKARCGCHEDSTPGVVLDPFLGSGTTAVVAEQLGRRWIGIEVNPEFAALAVKRVEDARIVKAMREAA